MTKISIIIPVYNTEDYLRKCLDSVVSQTLTDIEIVCINDGSTDGSLDILKEYSQKDNRIVVIDKENEGVSFARNIGLEKSSGEYIMFLDSDDYLLPEACQVAYDAVNKENADVGIYGHNILKINNRYVTTKIASKNDYMGFINVWNKIFRATFLKAHCIKFPEGIRTAEDIIFSYVVYFNKPKLSFINKHLMVYRDGRKGSSTTKDLREIESDISAFEYFVNTEIFKSQTLDDKLKVIDMFSSIVGWLAPKVKLKEEKIYCRSILATYLSLVEKDIDTKTLDNLPSYRRCKEALSAPKIKHKFLQKFYKVEISADELHKIRSILGIKFKSRKFKFKENHRIISDRYSEHLNKIRKIANSRKIRVGFLVNNVIWKYQNIYDLLASSEYYEPFVIVSKNQELDSVDSQKASLLDIYNTFKSKNMNVYMAYDFEQEESLSLRIYKPDVIFYSRSYGLDALHDAFIVSKFALSCYVPYFVSNSPAIVEAGSLFHSLLWRYYVLNEDLIREYTPVMKNNGTNLKVSGYPFLDSYSKSFSKDKNFVIYAPHWSVGGKTPLNYATFEWNGDYILEYAKKHPEFNWVFKPHPILKGTLVETGIWTQERVDRYYEEWAKIGIKYEGADYLDLFKQSKCLITDCGSFLAEYMPTKNPVILLRSDKATPFNFLAQKVTKYYYKAHNLEELNNLLEEVVVRGEDKDREKRLEMLDELQLITNASQNIIDDLNETFGIAEKVNQ